ncbi:hypothetical protein HYC85_004283 [Camellia sinensis]|uniref:Uncharacterized protein n=1 Tax=Camellia sinensis TaxID=4442 RepID=A0A7J7HYS7_CAMSI|nr:hypothetical protein HYC85_004283 [Camellia sinensis]
MVKLGRDGGNDDDGLGGERGRRQLLRSEGEAVTMEVAGDIVQKEEPDEASNIFMGLKPVSEIKEVVVQNVENGDSKDKVVESEEKKTDIVIGTSCQCSCTSSIMESPDDLQLKLKEPLSAPF